MAETTYEVRDGKMRPSPGKDKDNDAGAKAARQQAQDKGGCEPKKEGY